MSLQQHFKTKYDLFIESTNYDQSFSWIDGFLFYDMFIELSIFEPTNEQKQTAWNKVVNESWKNWYVPTSNNPQPMKNRFINQSKHLLFKDFVYQMAEDVELSGEVIGKLGFN